MDDLTAISSSQSIDLTPKSVLECLRDAKDQLDDALLRLARGESLGDETTGTQPTSSDAIHDASLDDPEDLAAAFFAQQARKQHAEMKLPIYEWAKTIHAISQTRPGRLDDESAKPLVHEHTKDGFCTADELWNEFKVAYGQQEM